MRTLQFGRHVLSSCVAAALLAACGGSQPPLGAPGAMPQSRSIVALERARSWILPEAKSGDLIYAVGGCGGTCVLSYPKGKLVGALDVGNAPPYSSDGCTDKNGNVFITSDTEVVEYAHGGTEPIATLNLPGNDAAGCSIDSTTNNLAVVMFKGYGGNIAVFANESGTPLQYNSGLDSLYCGYDNAGNLFTGGANFNSGEHGQPALSELPSGGSAFTILSTNATLDSDGQVQWDGQYITNENGRAGKRQVAITRLAISGSEATVVGTTSIKQNIKRLGASWIHASAILVPYSATHAFPNRIGIWKYPAGGKAVKVIDKFGQYGDLDLSGVTLSAAPSH